MLLLAHRLAFHFRRPVSELDISMREFYHWLAYLRIEDPEARADRRTASLMAQITNMSGKMTKQRVTAADFLPKEPTGPQTAEQQMDFLRSMSNG